MLRRFFSYVPSEPFPEAPEVESPDPNTDRELPDSFRSARRSLVALCAVSLAWSTAQFSLGEVSIDAAGITVDLKNASIPLLLGMGLVYLIWRWMVEYAMMPRHVRRWPLAQLDFRVVSVVARFSLLALTAAALDRSLRSVGIVALLLAALALVVSLLSVVLMFTVTMPIRMWARERANRVSAASAVEEGIVWSVVFGVCLTVAGTVALGIASYRYEPLRLAIWPVPPHPVAVGIFMFTLIATFLSYWLMRPLTSRLFAERPNYWTERTDGGGLRVRFVDRGKEPLL
jgi:lysylphosphatidylglycerol synthetase-like protein (DUF2156 family)